MDSLQKNCIFLTAKQTSRKFSLFKEELVGREPGSSLSLEDKGKDHEKKRKNQVIAEFCTRKMADFLASQARTLDWPAQIVRKIGILNMIWFLESE